MKYIIAFLFVSMTACSQQRKSFEDQQMDCLINTFREQNVNLLLEMRNFETHLISKNVLKDEKGSSYYNIYQTINKKGDIDFDFEYSFLDSLKIAIKDEAYTLSSDCLSNANEIKESKSYLNSKTHQLQLCFDSLRAINNTGVQDVSHCIINIMDENDFNKNYHKLTTLLLLANTHNINTGINRVLPSKRDIKKPIHIKQRNIILLLVSEQNDSLLFNTKPLAIDSLSQKIHKYIISDPNDPTLPEFDQKEIKLLGKCSMSKLVISLKTKREASYSTYSNIQDILLAAYYKVRNLKAQQYFKLEYNVLNSEQKAAIDELVPIRISENEPI